MLFVSIYLIRLLETGKELDELLNQFSVVSFLGIPTAFPSPFSRETCSDRQQSPQPAAEQGWEASCRHLNAYRKHWACSSCTKWPSVHVWCTDVLWTPEKSSMTLQRRVSGPLCLSYDRRLKGFRCTQLLLVLPSLHIFLSGEAMSSLFTPPVMICSVSTIKLLTFTDLLTTCYLLAVPLPKET